jgi:anti-sigma B factor antagonist
VVIVGTLSSHIPNFGYKVTGDDPVVVAVWGEVDIFTAPELSATFDDLISAGNHHLVRDLSAVEFMDSLGPNLLTKAAADLEKAGGSLHVSSASHRVRRVVELAGMDGLLPFPAARHSMES